MKLVGVPRADLLFYKSTKVTVMATVTQQVQLLIILLPTYALNIVFGAY